MYGLKQPPHAWYEKIHAYLTAFGFQSSPTQSTLYVKHKNNVLLIIVPYIDDMLLIGPNEKQIVDFEANLNVPSEMANLRFFLHYLGIELKQVDGGIALCQKKVYSDTFMEICP